MKPLHTLIASLSPGLIAAIPLPPPPLPTVTITTTTTRTIIAATATVTAPLPPPQHLLPRDPLPTTPHHGSSILLLPRHPRKPGGRGRGHLTKLVDHILDRLGHRLDKLTHVSSDGRVTINAPKCIGIGISACNPVHVGDSNRAEAGGWAGRVVEGTGKGQQQHHGGGGGDKGEVDGQREESEGSSWEGEDWSGGTKKEWKSRKKEWKQKEKKWKAQTKEWKKAAKEERKKNRKEGKKKHKWSGDWGFGDDSSSSSSSSSEGGSGRANADQGDRHVEEQGSASDQSDNKSNEKSHEKSHEKEAGEIDWNWGEDSVDFQPDKAGWANLAVAGRRR